MRDMTKSFFLYENLKNSVSGIKLKSGVSSLQNRIYHAFPWQGLIQNSSKVFDFVFGLNFAAFALNI